MEKILVVVDMQNDFIDGVLGTKEAVNIVDNVVEKINNFDGKIFVTLDTHYYNYMETLEGKKLPVPHCIKNKNGWMLNDKVLLASLKKNYKVIEKSTFGSERLVDEIQYIKRNGEIEVEIIGLCTDICVVSNALLIKTYLPESNITVDASCCAGTDPDAHKAALLVMKSCQIDITGEDYD